MKRFITTAAAIFTLTALVGCNGPDRFPFGASYDKHSFLSTPSQPLTVQLIDTFSGQTIWTLDIPVGMKGVVDLGIGSGMLQGNPPNHAKEIRWGIFKPDQGTSYESLPQKMPLSGNPVMLNLVVRDPEPYTAPDVTPAIVPPPTAAAPEPEPEPAPVQRNFSTLRARDN
ncbi:MAG: hypothetical protein ACYTGQ_14045 [Planctomycetota bacterium]|jgi:hypothetical protein